MKGEQKWFLREQREFVVGLPGLVENTKSLSKGIWGEQSHQCFHTKPVWQLFLLFIKLVHRTTDNETCSDTMWTKLLGQ